MAGRPKGSPNRGDRAIVRAEPARLAMLADAIDWLLSSDMLLNHADYLPVDGKHYRVRPLPPIENAAKLDDAKAALAEVAELFKQSAVEAGVLQRLPRRHLVGFSRLRGLR